MAVTTTEIYKDDNQRLMIHAKALSGVPGRGQFRRRDAIRELLNHYEKSHPLPRTEE